MNDDDFDGARINRGKAKKPKTTASPTNLMECEQGARVVVVLEVSAWLSGPKDDSPIDRLVRVIDPRTGVRKTEVLNIPYAAKVACVRIDDFDINRNKED